ncbi:Sensory box/GGDEF domain/EAL domain protein [Pseudomonas amygdali pv. eriobotryae]|uniref:Sensory box/GGDEF domain/EAL domain protein n=1 Tax=Pseudomonas amygdali pv. eriobotryae TaxID=129137 RepID=A0A3M3VRT1_PSEA0|nr:Sensory box/GGDEF domain/EAL domain protein [Pseudomonas amygdali pv. eriobotryae]
MREVIIDTNDREASCLSEGKFASVFAQCPDAMIIASLADGHIMDANAAFVERTGLTLDEVIGKTPTQLDLWAVPGIGPKVLQQLQTGNIHNLEIPFRRKNGETFSGLMSAQPFDQSSTPAVLVIVRDITQRKQAQQQLQLSEEKFAKAFHASPDGLAITRQQDGMLLEVNEGFCRITGYSEAYCLEHSTFDLGVWVDLGDRSRLIEQLKRHGSVRDFRARLRNVDGSIRLCELSSHPIVIAGDDCLLTIARDITESRQMQEKLHLAATVFESTAQPRACSLPTPTSASMPSTVPSLRLPATARAKPSARHLACSPQASMTARSMPQCGINLQPMATGRARSATDARTASSTQAG